MLCIPACLTVSTSLVFIYVCDVASLMRAIQTYQARRERRSNWKHLCRGGLRVHHALSPAKLNTLAEFPKTKTRLRKGGDTAPDAVFTRVCVCVCVSNTRYDASHTPPYVIPGAEPGRRSRGAHGCLQVLQETLKSAPSSKKLQRLKIINTFCEHFLITIVSTSSSNRKLNRCHTL